jgi:cubilin
MLQVYDGFDQTAPLLFKGYGGDLPDPIRSSSNVVYIVFESNPLHHGSKFLLEWLQVDRQITSMIIPPPTSE